jgi:hypothetical protein
MRSVCPWVRARMSGPSDGHSSSTLSRCRCAAAGAWSRSASLAAASDARAASSTTPARYQCRASSADSAPLWARTRASPACRSRRRPGDKPSYTASRSKSWRTRNPRASTRSRSAATAASSAASASRASTPRTWAISFSSQPCSTTAATATATCTTGPIALTRDRNIDRRWAGTPAVPAAATTSSTSSGIPPLRRWIRLTSSGLGAVPVIARTCSATSAASSASRETRTIGREPRKSMRVVEPGLWGSSYRRVAISPHLPEPGWVSR